MLDELPEGQQIDATAEIDEATRVTGRVRIEAGTRIANCIVRGPVVIGQDCVLRDAYVGPYTALGNRVCITGSEIEHSIVLDDSRIVDLGGRIEDSLIATHVEVSRTRVRPAAHRLMLGDDSKVDMGSA